MDDALLVAVVQRVRDVQHVSRAPLLPEATLAQLLVKLAPGSELEDEVDASVVVEVPKQAEDVPVPEGGGGAGVRGKRW